MEWAIEDLTKGEVQQSFRNLVVHVQEVPLQGFSSVPVGFLRAGFCNVKVNYQFSCQLETDGRCAEIRAGGISW